MVTRLAADLQREFPDQRGWSRSNLLYMRRAAETWPTEAEFVHHVGGRLPWRHVTVLLDRLDSREERDWYADAPAESGWTRGVLKLQIRSGLRTAMGAAPTNFTKALDSPDSELAQQLVKDPYVFEHLGLVKSLAERDVEQALMDRLQDTMLQLARGMAFIGRQVRLSVPDDRSDQVDEFYVDLLFFNVEQLRCAVVELKVGKFEPAHIGQLGTYVAIVDDQYRRPAIHAPTLGILLCTGKSGPTVRYSLASTTAPIAVATTTGCRPTPAPHCPRPKSCKPSSPMSQADEAGPSSSASYPRHLELIEAANPAERIAVGTAPPGDRRQARSLRIVTVSRSERLSAYLPGQQCLPLFCAYAAPIGALTRASMRSVVL